MTPVFPKAHSGKLPGLGGNVVAMENASTGESCATFLKTETTWMRVSICPSRSRVSLSSDLNVACMKRDLLTSMAFGWSIGISLIANRGTGT